MMDKEKFSELAVEGYTVVPLKQKIQTQYQDPISLFKKVRSIKDSFYLNPSRVEINGLNIQSLGLIAVIPFRFTMMKLR